MRLGDLRPEGVACRGEDEQAVVVARRGRVDPRGTDADRSADRSPCSRRRRAVPMRRRRPPCNYCPERPCPPPVRDGPATDTRRRRAPRRRARDSPRRTFFPTDRRRPAVTYTPTVHGWHPRIRAASARAMPSTGRSVIGRILPRDPPGRRRYPQPLPTSVTSAYLRRSSMTAPLHRVRAHSDVGNRPCGGRGARPLLETPGGAASSWEGRRSRLGPHTSWGEHRPCGRTTYAAAPTRAQMPRPRFATTGMSRPFGDTPATEECSLSLIPTPTSGGSTTLSIRPTRPRNGWGPQ
jgi:hypothetical protein